MVPSSCLKSLLQRIRRKRHIDDFPLSLSLSNISLNLFLYLLFSLRPSLYPFSFPPSPSLSSPLLIHSLLLISVSLSPPSSSYCNHKTRVHFYAAFTVLSRGSFSTQEETPLSLFLSLSLSLSEAPFPNVFKCRKRTTRLLSRSGRCSEPMTAVGSRKMPVVIGAEEEDEIRSTGY